MEIKSIPINKHYRNWNTVETFAVIDEIHGKLCEKWEYFDILDVGTVDVYFYKMMEGRMNKTEVILMMEKEMMDYLLGKGILIISKVKLYEYFQKLDV